MNLQNMAPNAKRSMLITAIFASIAIVIYLFPVKQAIENRDNTNRMLSQLQDEHRKMQINLAGADKLLQRLKDLEEKLAPYRDAMLEPLLESRSMRAKSILDPLAFGAGLADTEYTELGQIALPVPKRLPYQLHARQPIKFTARGSYQSAISFLMRVEKELPLVTLEALEITAQKDPNDQKIEMIFEWPVQGRISKLDPSKKKGGKR